MKSSVSKNQGLKFWVLAGLTGIFLFTGLLSQFYFFTDAPISYSKEEALAKTSSLYQRLNIETDTLGMVPFRQQRFSLYRAIRDSLESETPTPAQLNRENFHLHGWDIIAASTLGLNESFNLSANGIFDNTGFYRTQLDNAGQIKLFEVQSDRGGIAKASGEKGRENAERIVKEIFLYNLDEYRQVDILNEEFSYDESVPEVRENRPEISVVEDPSLFRWVKEAGAYSEFIELELGPVPQSAAADVENTVSVQRFEAYHEMEKIPPKTTDDLFVVFFISVIALLALVTFIEGLGQVFKGKADWKRILFIAVGVTMGIFFWRLIFMLNFFELLTLQANIVIQFNQLIFGLVMGLFGAIAYIGWEAYARGEKKYQIDLIDAYWSGRLYLKETGSGIITGFSIAGVMLGITAVYMMVSDLFLYHSDSQFGFTEVINRPQFLSINISVFVITALTSVSMVGIVYNFFSKRIRKQSVVLVLSIILGGLFFTGLGRSFATSGSELQEIGLFILISVPLFIAYSQRGIVTVFAAIWLFTSVVTILPYLGSPSLDVASVSWIQIILAGSIAAFGTVAYRRAPSAAGVERYVPDYEKKMMRNIRIENEMEIARITQQKLMPFAPLESEEYDLHGYFLPSFEVGGDYFDYVKGVGNTLTLAVVDVSGKSMRAAMQAVFTSGLLRSRMYTDKPSKILREVCPVIYDKTDSRTFITCLIGRYDPEKQILTLANAGHCLPILKRDGKAEFLKTPEPKFPLGIRSAVDYKDLSVIVRPGDLFFFYSDGFPEAVNSQGERIGFDRALKYVEDLDSENLSAKETCNRIKEYIEEFSIERLADDTTILCLKIK